MLQNNELSFNFSNEAWNELCEEQQKKLTQIYEWKLDFLLGEPLSNQGIKPEFHKSAVEELKKFLSIKIIYGIRHMGMFGPNVVRAWRAFEADKINYEKFCKDNYGKMITRVPGHKQIDDTTVWLKLYHHSFGKLPDVWKTDLAGKEISGFEKKMNVELCCDNDHLDSDDSVYEVMMR